MLNLKVFEREWPRPNMGNSMAFSLNALGKPRKPHDIWCLGRNSNQAISRAQHYVFFSGEGPRSRRYGRTAALRFLVQPCDEDDDDDDYNFCILFLVIEHRENQSTRGKTCPSATLSSTNPTWADLRDRTRASAVGGRRLTAWAMARSQTTVLLLCKMSLKR
jgi:hypothetical protein